MLTNDSHCGCLVSVDATLTNPDPLSVPVMFDRLTVAVKFAGCKLVGDSVKVTVGGV